MAVEWWVVELNDSGKPHRFLCAGLRTYREAMAKARELSEGNHIVKFMLVKTTSRISFEAHFSQVIKIVPKALEDMVQCPTK